MMAKGSWAHQMTGVCLDCGGRCRVVSLRCQECRRKAESRRITERIAVALRTLVEREQREAGR